MIPSCRVASALAGLVLAGLALCGCAIDVKSYWPNPDMAGQYRLTRVTGNHDGWVFAKLAPDWQAFSITDANCSVDYYFWITPTEQAVEGLIQPISTGSRQCPADGWAARFSVPPLLWMLPRFIDPTSLPLVMKATAKDVGLAGAATSVHVSTIIMTVSREGELYAVQWTDEAGNGETLWAGMIPICGETRTAPGIVRYKNTWGNEATYCWGEKG